ncbi:MAG: DUF3667 domain-containing protein [Chitinophagaceae bacterium]
MNCRNCNQAVSEKYCGHCGNPVVLKKVDSHYIIHEIQHVLHFEKGILYTIKALLLQPGKSIRGFISEDRSRLVKPVIFLIITSLVYTSIAHFFHIDRSYNAPGQPKNSALIPLMSWIDNHYGYANIIMGVFIAFWLKLMCRKSNYNFFELLIMLCFVTGTGMLIFAVFTLAEGITKVNMSFPGGAVTFVYCAWAIGDFLGGKKIPNYLRVVAAYLLGILSLTILAILLGIIVAVFQSLI